MDKTISCIKCQKTFIMTVQMKYIYYSKSFSLPKHCPQCLEERKENREREVECQRKRLYESAKKSLW